MKRLLRLVAIMILMCVVVGNCASCVVFDSLFKEPEQTQAPSTTDEKESITEAETENPNSLEQIVGVRLERDTKRCHFYFSGRPGFTLTGVKKVLVNIDNQNTYLEVNANYEMILDEKKHVLTHMIVVFEKNHNIPDREYSIIQKFDINFMFER